MSAVKEPSHRQFLSLSLPNILANLAVPAAELIDMALLGHLESITPLAGVALATLIFDYAYWSLNFLRSGTTGLTALALGRDNSSESAGVFYRSMLIALAAGLAMVVLQVPIANFGFALLDGGPAVEAAGKAYFYARVWAAPATLCGFVVVGWLLGRGHARAALAYALVLNGINIFFDWWFIFQLGWGARGAGLATMIAEFAALGVGVLLVRHFWGRHPRFSWDLVFEGSMFADLLKLQGNIMVRSFCLITAFATFINLSAGFGPVVLAANSILVRLLNTAAYFIDGFAFALETLAGKYAGAKKPAGVSRSLNMALAWNLLVVAGFLLLFTFAGDWVLGLLTSHDPVLDQASSFLPFVSVTLVISGFAYIYDGFYFGLARGPLLRDSMLISTIFFFVPLAVTGYFAQSQNLLWLSMVAFMLGRTLTLGIPAWRETRVRQ